MDQCPILANPEEYKVESAHVCGAPVANAMILFKDKQSLLEAKLNVCRARCPFYFECNPEQMQQYGTLAQDRTLIGNSDETFTRERALTMFPNV